MKFLKARAKEMRIGGNLLMGNATIITRGEFKKLIGIEDSMDKYERVREKEKYRCYESMFNDI